MLDFILMSVLFLFMLILSIIDIKYMLLPKNIVWCAIILGFGIQCLKGYTMGSIEPVTTSLLGGIVGCSILSIIFYSSLFIFKKEGMGYGDIRYLGMIGIFTNMIVVMRCLIIASVIGSIYGILYYLKNKKSIPYPFGPFLSIGAIISLFIL
ncbi:hypothetical protein AN639_03755 [Candidatus Epulonipiscium fishelsonii]|uniref:Uncharacterized protein n=1 Tax=Candidatus Epulonipiscium fishelsonii TaxID=77094 RepID=A0ACC8X6G9_9FIRM|nr:hypothetical protein AN396_12770 [Epulopiscium sp. SCG-B11WGA-EpuloA1]ONI41477.1 hypothetical protein AN639_03755 [Epulopiscium sp. SCG-B05WGA-EpuloA1]